MNIVHAIIVAIAFGLISVTATVAYFNGADFHVAVLIILWVIFIALTNDLLGLNKVFRFFMQIGSRIKN